MNPVGIIPARAGFTSREPSARPESPDHPRSRGVYFGKVDYITFNDGSSPLARGLRLFEGDEGKASRIIPARAGFTGSLRFPVRETSDHPRSRGVYVKNRPERPVGQGSSPLARGLLLITDLMNVTGRIIPARAGFTTGGT